MIDEYFERLVDWLCVVVPRFLKPRKTLMANSGLGWRMLLYFSTLGRKISGAFSHISNEDNMDLFLRETAERSDDHFARMAAFIKEQLALLVLLDERGRSIRFSAMLLMTMLAAVGVGMTGSAFLAMAAASLCLMWLSVAVESDYAPIAGGLRQSYLVCITLRSVSIAMMLPYYFILYAENGIPSNVLLQGAMIITLSIHVILYLTLIVLNTRQPLFLRALAGILGCAPALTAAAALALAAASVFRPWPMPLCGVLSAVGAVLAFLGDQLITITHLGGIRLKYHSIWVCLFMTVGYACMLAGAWTYAP